MGLLCRFFGCLLFILLLPFITPLLCGHWACEKYGSSSMEEVGAVFGCVILEVGILVVLIWLSGGCL